MFIAGGREQLALLYRLLRSAPVSNGNPAVTKQEAQQLQGEALFAVLFVAPSVYVTCVLLITIGLWFAYGRVDTLLLCCWAAYTAVVASVRQTLSTRFRAASSEERVRQEKFWHVVAYAMPLTFPTSYVPLLLMTFPVVDLYAKLVISLYGYTLAIGMVGIFSVTGPFATFATLGGMAFAWYFMGGDYAVTGTVVTLTMLLLFYSLHSNNARDTYERLALEKHTQRLNQELALRNAKLEAMDQQKNLLLATASHDLRQPVHALEMLVEGTALADDYASGRRTLGKMRSQVDLLSDMLRGLLDISQLDLGIYRPHISTFDVNGLIQEVVNLHADHARRKGLQLVLALDRSNGFITTTDRGLMGRMLSNLIGNAVKYTLAGHVMVSTEPGAPGQLRIHVVDTGVGIAPEKQADIFSAYVRSGNSELMRSVSGFGIGLAILDQGARLLGMKVEMESELNRGSRFTLVFEATQGMVTDPAAVDARPPDAALPNTCFAKVLLVDDDEVILKATLDLLKLWGFDARVAADVDSACKLVSKEGFVPDILISDYQLGDGRTGTDCIQTIRQLTGRTHIPSILLTGDMQVNLEVEAQALPTLVLHKPIRPKRLRDSLVQLEA